MEIGGKLHPLLGGYGVHTNDLITANPAKVGCVMPQAHAPSAIFGALGLTSITHATRSKQTCVIFSDLCVHRSFWVERDSYPPTWGIGTPLQPLDKEKALVGKIW
jgi:hypothetical protein